MKINLTFFLFMVFISSCSTKYLQESPMEFEETHSKKSSVQKRQKISIAPNSVLLSSVPVSIMDTVRKRIQMDSDPDIVYFEKTGQWVRDDMPEIDISSLKFYPVIAVPFYQTDTVPSIDQRNAFLHCKTKDGKELYIKAKYTDWAAIVEQNKNNGVYEKRKKIEGAERVQKGINSLLLRRGVDNWSLIFFKDSSIRFTLAEYARRESDNGEFFMITKGEYISDICFFKNGKLMVCKKTNIQAPIRLQEL
jgi:hypothetical protein